MCTVAESAECECDVLLPELEVDESPAELRIVESHVKTLYSVEHQTSDCAVSAESVVVGLDSHVCIEWHGVPR